MAKPGPTKRKNLRGLLVVGFVLLFVIAPLFFYTFTKIENFNDTSYERNFQILSEMGRDMTGTLKVLEEVLKVRIEESEVLISSNNTTDINDLGPLITIEEYPICDAPNEPQNYYYSYVEACIEGLGDYFDGFFEDEEPLWIKYKTKNEINDENFTPGGLIILDYFGKQIETSKADWSENTEVEKEKIQEDLEYSFDIETFRRTLSGLEEVVMMNYFSEPGSLEEQYAIEISFWLEDVDFIVADFNNFTAEEKKEFGILFLSTPSQILYLEYLSAKNFDLEAKKTALQDANFFGEFLTLSNKTSELDKGFNSGDGFQNWLDALRAVPGFESINGVKIKKGGCKGLNDEIWLTFGQDLEVFDCRPIGERIADKSAWNRRLINAPPPTSNESDQEITDLGSDFNIPYFKVELPLSSLMSSLESGHSFDGLFIADYTGQILYPSGEMLGNLKRPVHLTSLSSIEELHDDHVTEAGELFPGKALNLANARLVETDLAGERYLVFIQPHMLPFEVKLEDREENSEDQKSPIYMGVTIQAENREKGANGNSGEKKNAGVETKVFYVVGILKKPGPFEVVSALPLHALGFTMFALIMLILAWPFLKLRFIGTQEKLRTGDVFFIGAGLFLGPALVSIFVLTMAFHIFDKDDRFDKISENIAERMVKDFQKELNTSLEILEKNQYPGNVPQNQENDFPSPEIRTGSNGKQTFPKFEILNAFGKDGTPIGTQVSYRKSEGKYFEVNDREYFQRALSGRLWSWTPDQTEGQPETKEFNFFLQQVRSRITGQKLSILAVKSYIPGNGAPAVLTMTKNFLTFRAPVLPPYYGFAGFNIETCEVLFHSDEKRVLLDNICNEIAANSKIHAAGAGGYSAFDDTLYHDKSQRLYITPLVPDTPLRLVVFFDKSFFHTLLFEIAVIAMAMTILVTVLAFIVLLMVHFFPSRFNYAWGWLWPDPVNKTHDYRKIILLLFLSSIFYLSIIVGVSGWLLLFAAIEGGVFAIGFSVYFISSKKEHGPWATVLWKLGLILDLIFKGGFTMVAFSTGGVMAVFSPLFLAIFLLVLYQLYFSPEKTENSLSLGFIQSGIKPFFSLLEKARFSMLFTTWLFLLVTHSSILLGVAFYKDAWRFETDRFTRFAMADQVNQMRDRHQILNRDLEKLNVFFKTPEEKEGLGLTGDQRKIGVYDIVALGGPISITPKRNSLTYSFLSEYLGKLLYPLNDRSQVFHHGFKENADAKRLVWDDHGNHFNLASKNSLKWTSIYNLENLLNPPPAGKNVVTAPKWPMPWLGMANLWMLLLGFLPVLVILYFLIKILNVRVFGIRIRPYPEKIMARGEMIEKIRKLLIFSKEKGVQVALIIRPELEDLLKRLGAKPKIDCTVIRAVDWEGKLGSKQKLLPSKNGILIIEEFQEILGTSSLDRLTEHLAIGDKGPGLILLTCDIHPLNAILHPEEYPEFAHKGMVFNLAKYSQEDLRALENATRIKQEWVEILSSSLTYYWPPADDSEVEYPEGSSDREKALRNILNRECQAWSSLRPILKHLKGFSLLEGRFSGDDLIAEIVMRARPFYSRLWRFCTWRERLLLYKLSQGYLVNPTNRALVLEFLRRGILRKNPELKLANESFRRFIVTAETPEQFAEWENELKSSTWSIIKIPFFIILMMFVVGLFYIGGGAIQSTFAIFASAAAVIPIIIRLLSVFSGQRGSVEES